MVAGVETTIRGCLQGSTQGITRQAISSRWEYAICARGWWIRNTIGKIAPTVARRADCAIHDKRFCTAVMTGSFFGREQSFRLHEDRHPPSWGLPRGGPATA